MTINNNNNNNNNNQSIASEAISNTLKTTKGKQGLFVMIPVKISGMSAKRTVKSLRQLTADGVDVSDNKKVSNPSIEFIESKSIAFAGRYRDKVITIFRQCGFNLGNSLYLTEEKHIHHVYTEILKFKKEFDADVLTFVDEYDEKLEAQILLNPSIAKEIMKHSPTRASIVKSFKFRIGVPQALQIKSTFEGIDKLLEEAGESINPACHVIDPIIESIAADMTHFWRYNLRSVRAAIENKNKRDDFSNPLNNRNGIKGVFMTVLKNMKTKIEDLYVLEPKLHLLADEVDRIVNMIPGGYNRADVTFSDYDVAVKMNEMASRLMDPAYITQLISVNHAEQADIDDAEFITQALSLEAEKQNSQVEEVTVDLAALFSTASTLDSETADANLALHLESESESKDVSTNVDAVLRLMDEKLDEEIASKLQSQSETSDITLPINFSNFDETEVEVTSSQATKAETIVDADFITQALSTETIKPTREMDVAPQLETYETLQSVDLSSLFASL